MNHFNFSGRLAATPVLTGTDAKSRVKFVLIRNQSVGKGKDGETVAIPFVAFDKQAKTIAQHCMKGDQLFVLAKIENNAWTDSDGQKHFDYNFLLKEFEFGAPGEATRARRAKRGK